MKSIKNLTLLLTSLFILSFGLFSCKAIKTTLLSAKQSIANVDTTFQKISVNIDEIQKAIVPVDTMVANAVNGALSGLTSDDSKAKLDTLSAMLTRNIIKSVNSALDSIDLESPGQKLITGIKDSLFAQSTSDELTALINTVFGSAKNEIIDAINAAFSNLSSEKNKQKLKGLGSAIVSGITDSLGYKLNESIKQVDFNSLRDSILKNLINQQFRDSLALVTKSVTEGAATEVEGVVAFIRKNVIKILWGLGLLAGGIFWWLYKFRRKDVDDISSLIMTEISAAGDHEKIKELKASIKKKAEKHKLEDKLNKMLKEKDLL